MRQLLFVICCAVWSVMWSHAASASEIRSEHLTARLVVENQTTRPGDLVTVALHQRIAPGWHTYWINPGDSGQAPVLDWKLPADVAAPSLHWPVPERQQSGPLVNYGYSGQTAILHDFRVPDDWPAGKPLELFAEAEILVCADICIPVVGQLSATIPTGIETSPVADERDLFRTIRERLPLPAPWEVSASEAGGQFGLHLAGPESDFSGISDAYFFIDSWGGADHAAAQSMSIGRSGLTVSVPRGEGSLSDRITGVLTLKTVDGPERSFLLRDVPLSAASVLPADKASSASAVNPPSLALLVVLALAGGILLNLMPCVFPVLAMKAMALARSRDKPARRKVMGGSAYTAGVIVSFLALAGVLLGLKAGGKAVGWGFQLQEPFVVGLLAYVAVAVGFNLLGMFEVGGRLSGAGTSWRFRSDLAESFATGVLAAVVAAPCTAPFMATAIGGAMLLPPVQTLLVFLALGLGLALPYLVLTIVPGTGNWLPRPGAWMVTFRQALAFPMFATAAWLIWVLGQQAGQDAAFMVTLGAIALAIVAWLNGVMKGSGFRRACAVAAPMLVSASLLGWAATMGPAATPDESAKQEIALPYTEVALTGNLDAGRPVFVNMTAAWCITCKVNERVALTGDAFTDTLEELGIVYLKGDWTNRNPEITAFLERFERLGVPLYVLFPADGRAPVVLPQILQPGALRTAFEGA